MADYRDMAAALSAGYGQDTGPITADTLITLKNGKKTTASDLLGMLKGFGQSVGSNLESLGRGGVASVIGAGGDLETFGRMGLNKLYGAGGVNVSETPILPTSTDILGMMPRATVPRRETAGMEELGGYMTPATAKVLKPVATGAVKMAGQEISNVASGMPSRSLLGDITPKPKQIFIGENAQTWNKAAADQAVQMEKAGARPEDIWAATGTFRGAEGKLRQEISDVLAKWQPTKWDTPYKIKSQPDLENIKMSDVGSSFSHPELLNAYSKLKEANVLVNPYLESKGSWHSANPEIGIDIPYMQLNQTFNSGVERDWLKRMTNPNDPDYWKNQARYAIKEGFAPKEAIKNMRNEIAQTQQKIDDMKAGIVPGGTSVALHELQHGVQGIEGFAKGGNVAQFAHGPMFNENARNLAADLSKAITGGYSATPSEVLKSLKYASQQDIEPIVKKYGFQNTDEAVKFLKYEDEKRTPYGQYKRLAGEAEARAVQKRMNMTPEQRRAKFPYESYDVPINDLIVRK